MRGRHRIPRKWAFVGTVPWVAMSILVVASWLRAGESGQIGHVFYIEMENHNLTQPATDTIAPRQLLGNPAAPFLNSLMTPGHPNAQLTSYAAAYHNVLATPSGKNPDIHPSEPNYIWQEAGDNFNVRDDWDPYTPHVKNVFDTPCLSGLLQSAGISWKSYQEDTQLARDSTGNVTYNTLPRSEWTVPLKAVMGTSTAYTNPYNGSHQYDFAPKHDGHLFFTSTNGGTLTVPDTSMNNPEASHYAPLQQLAADLAGNSVGRYNLITADQYNEMHSPLDTPFAYDGTTYAAKTDQESVALGDHFLSVVVPMIEASQAFKDNGVIVIWFDETEGTNENDFSHALPEIIISPLAKGNAYQSKVNYTHSSDLKTLEEVFGLRPLLGDAASPEVHDLSDLFRPGVVPAVDGPAGR